MGVSLSLAATAGYSATPLPKKLGLKADQAVAFLALPESLAQLASAAPFAAVTQTDWDGKLERGLAYDLIHAFTASARELSAGLPRLRAAIKPGGMIWISWPKKASKVPSDVTEDVVRDLALKIDLVDVKVCAVDAVWSGLKLVIPKAQRGRNSKG